MAADFEAEGLWRGVGDERARRARLELLRTLEAEGFSLEELRRAAEGRLALLPLEHVLEGEGPRYAEAEVAAETGLDVELLREARRATRAPRAEPGESVLTVDDLDLAKRSKRLLDAGLGPEAVLEATRVMSQAMSSVAAAMTTAFGEAPAPQATRTAISAFATPSRCASSVRWPAPRCSTCSTFACESRSATPSSDKPSCRPAGCRERSGSRSPSSTS